MTPSSQVPDPTPRKKQSSSQDPSGRLVIDLGLRRAVENWQRSLIPPSFFRQLREADDVLAASLRAQVTDVTGQVVANVKAPLEETFRKLGEQQNRAVREALSPLHLSITLSPIGHLSFSTREPPSTAQAQSVVSLVRSFSSRLSETGAHDATGLTDAIESTVEAGAGAGEFDVDLDTDLDEEYEEFADTVLEVLRQEAPEVADAIDYVAENADTQLDASAGRRILATLTFSTVLVLAVAGVMLPPPWNVIAVVILAVPQAKDQAFGMLGSSPEDK
ncbi:hypothetical protein NSA53_13635 [Cellulosimicrobium cellulans]|uniref:hypothetical protein n=1 Tax=Cellulosimicrobium cellulans TaxID=1710 RepID=UPI002149B9C3|nr:hypothetical protein [Cellulosimicrobium cellulans]